MATDTEYSKLEKRIAALESKATTTKKPRAPRAPSEYNKFMKTEMDKARKNGSTKSHQELFSEIAKEWSEKKKSSSKD